MDNVGEVMDSFGKKPNSELIALVEINDGADVIWKNLTVLIQNKRIESLSSMMLEIREPDRDILFLPWKVCARKLDLLRRVSRHMNVSMNDLISHMRMGSTNGVGDYIKANRESLESMGDTEISRELGIPISEIQDLEKTQMEPLPTIVEKISAYYNIPLELIIFPQDPAEVKVSVDTVKQPKRMGSLAGWDMKYFNDGTRKNGTFEKINKITHFVEPISLKTGRHIFILNLMHLMRRRLCRFEYKIAADIGSHYKEIEGISWPFPAGLIDATQRVAAYFHIPLDSLIEIEEHGEGIGSTMLHHRVKSDTSLFTLERITGVPREKLLHLEEDVSSIGVPDIVKKISKRFSIPMSELIFLKNVIVARKDPSPNVAVYDNDNRNNVLRRKAKKTKGESPIEKILSLGKRLFPDRDRYR